MIELLYTVFNRFSKAGKIRLISLIFSQMVLSLLDIIGLFLLGVVSALSVSNYDKSTAPNLVSRLLDTLGLSNLSFLHQISVLLGLIAVFFLTKTIVSIAILRRIYAVLAEQDVYFGQGQTLALFKKPYSYLRKFDSQDLLFALSGAVEQTIFGILGNGIILVTELGFITLLFLSLSFTNLALTLFSITYFLLAGFIFHKVSQEKLHKLSADANTLSIALNSNILESVGLIRELQLRNNYDYIIDRVNKSRTDLADARAKLSLWPNLSKYYVEVTFVIALFCIVVFSFLMVDTKAAIPSLTIFMVGLSRAIPSLLRIQMALIAIKQNEPGARFSLEMTSDQGGSRETDDEPLNNSNSTFIGSVSLKDITFSFDDTNRILDHANLEIKPGEFVSIVGKSGVGKSTLIDLILGFLIPNEGAVLISGMSPRNTENNFPGSIALVPQQIATLDANLVENITLQNVHKEPKDLENALDKAVVDFAGEGERDLLVERIGENGKGLSGGQRQRVGLARALYTNPKLLILDEATSALDSVTENKVRQQIEKMKGSTTIILIAHRLETLKMADRIILLEGARFREITLEEIERSGGDYLTSEPSTT
jgi:ABC-type bacteriocin/lantibiotic exporter with double-glycine peptidase domain